MLPAKVGQYDLHHAQPQEPRLLLKRVPWPQTTQYFESLTRPPTPRVPNRFEKMHRDVVSVTYVRKLYLNFVNQPNVVEWHFLNRSVILWMNKSARWYA